MNAATREAFGEALAELGDTNERIVSLDADLSCTTKSATFAKRHPDRFFNMGIAEADLMATAAGMATCGKIPFASTFAVFASCRALDQIRNSICYPCLNVKVVGTHAGPSCGEDGGSHQAVEDIAIMRALPNMVVVVAADDVEAKKVVYAAAAYDGPMYLRFARLASPTVHDESFEFDLFHGEVMREGTDVALIACGMMVPCALEAAERLAEEGIAARVVNMHTVKPIDADLVEECARTCGKIVTVEEANIVGGLGSAVCEVVAERCPVPVRRIGMPDIYGKSGAGKELLDEFGLSADHIIEVVKSF